MSESWSSSRSKTIQVGLGVGSKCYKGSCYSTHIKSSSLLFIHTIVNHFFFVPTLSNLSLTLYLY